MMKSTTSSNYATSEICNIVTVLLAEKRTSLAILRTGIAIFTLPLSVFTVLIATSNFYDINTSLHFIIPLVSICVVLILFAIYLMFRSFRTIKDIDNKIHEIKTHEIFLKDVIQE